MSLIADRIVQIKVGPPGQAGRLWRDLYVKFDVEQKSGSTPNKATVEFFNLSDDSIRYLESPGLVLQILAGSRSASTLFFGDISRKSVETEWAQPDYKTKITAADGRRIFRQTKFSRSYPAQTTRSQIFSDVLAAMGQRLTYYDPEIQEITYPASTSFCAHARTVLDELFEPDGSVWSIQGDGVQVLAQGRPAQRGAIVLSSDTGMIGVPKRTSNGVEVKADLNTGISPGAVVIVKSQILSGQYRVTATKHAGSTFGDQWETTAQGVAY